MNTINLTRFFLILSSLFLIYFFFSTGLLYEFLVPEDKNPNYQIGLFRDWIITLNDVYCEILKETKCRPFQYGPALQYLPFSEFLKDFYYKIFPILLVILFVISVFFILENNKFNFILAFLIIFSPTSLLAIERGNLDVLLFLISILICVSRFFYLSCFLASWSFLVKYYPLTFFANLFTYADHKSTKQIRLIAILLFITSLLFIFFNKKIFFDFFDNTSASKAGFHILYSIKAHAKFLKYNFDINYIVLLTTTYILYLILSIRFFSYLKKNNIFEKLNLKNFEDKLFLIGTNTALLNYLIFSNYYYREIFLILSIPLLLKLRNLCKIKIFNYLIYLVIIRYIFLHFYNYVILNEHLTYIDGVRTFYDSFLAVFFVKASLDFVLMIFLSSILFFYNLEIFKIFFKKK